MLEKITDYYSIRPSNSKDALKLHIQYLLETVPSPNPWFKGLTIPENFLDKFNYRLSGLSALDLLPNDLGWQIFSPRIVAVLKEARNAPDLEFHALPRKLVEMDRRLEGYAVLAVKKRVNCVDVVRSDILWTKIVDKEIILSFRKCVLDAQRVPQDLDVFVLGEYPVMVVLSDEIAGMIGELSPKGFVYWPIELISAN